MTNHVYKEHPPIQDCGPEAFCINIRRAAIENSHFRTAAWTGQHLQLTLMCIPVSGDIGAEMHNDTDQFIGIVQGRAKVYMGTCPHTLCEKAVVCDGGGFLIPAGTWHNVVNVGNEPLKLYSVYAPPHHPRATVHVCKEDA